MRQSRRQGKAGVVVVVLIAAAAGFACFFPQYIRLGKTQPPVAAGVRESLLGIGRVLRLTVTGDRPLLNVRVEAVNAAQNSRASHRLDRIDAGETKELGWREWDWSVSPGETVTVSADGYALPITFTSDQLGVR